MAKVWAVLSLSLLAAPAGAQSSATLRGVDVYRSEQVAVFKLEELFGQQLQSYVRLRNDGRKNQLKTAERLQDDVEEGVRKLGKFAYAAMHYGRYLTSAEQTAYITFDLVDAKDAKTRMPFVPSPSGSPPDPEGLVAAWRQYSELGRQNRLQGDLSLDRPSCPAFYCSWGSPTPELAALEKKFEGGVEKAKPSLLKVLAEEADPRKRAAAVYLLSYGKDGKAVAELMVKTLSDPASEPRQAALQVLSDVAVYAKTVPIDAARLIAALDFPATTDRVNAMTALIGLADRPDYAPLLKTLGSPRLLELLKAKQPSVHDLAFTLLGMLSKESFDRRDYKAWELWVASQTVRAAESPRGP